MRTENGGFGCDPKGFAYGDFKIFEHREVRIEEEESARIKDSTN